MDIFPNTIPSISTAQVLMDTISSSVGAAGENSTLGSAILGVCGVLGMWIVKGAVAAILEQVKKRFELINASSGALESFRESLAQGVAKNGQILEQLSSAMSIQVIPHMSLSRDNQEEIKDTLLEIRDDRRSVHLNNLDSSVSISTVLVTIGNFNFQIHLWYESRERVNHIKENFDHISQIYEKKRIKLDAKILTQFMKYPNLNGWVTQEGVEIMTKVLMNTLINYQLSKATGKLSLHDNSASILSSWQSLWGDSCRDWSLNKTTLKEWALEHAESLDIEGGLEFL